jgi:hypothetical protein
VVAGTQTIALENPANYPGLSAAALPNELLEGAVSSWMNVQAAPLLVSATLQYSGAATAESAQVFDASNQRVIYTRVTGTDATTQTYSRLTSATDAEAIPAGLAAAIYAAAGVLQYDGALELTEPECTGAAAPGQLLNLTGGRTEWAAMQAQVQRVEEALELGRTTITVGPAKHLGQGEITAWLRANRHRRLSYRLQERTSGTGSGNAAKVLGGEHTPRSDSIFRPSASAVAVNRPFQLLNASDASGLKVMVNANSFLQRSLTPNDLFPITGLGAPMAVSVGTMVWLEIDFDPTGTTPMAAAIASGTGGWANFPLPCAFTGTGASQVLASAFVLLGYIAAAGSTLDGSVITGGPATAPVTAKVVQCVWADLLLQNVVYDGMPAIYAFPHHAPSI